MRSLTWIFIANRRPSRKPRFRATVRTPWEPPRFAAWLFYSAFAGFALRLNDRQREPRLRLFGRRRRRQCLAGVGPEIVEKLLLGEAVKPAFFRDFLAGGVLRRSRLHAFQFGHCAL